MHHPESAGELDHLFAGYGRRPPWAERQAATLAKCREMLSLMGADNVGTGHWQRKLEITAAWVE